MTDKKYNIVVITKIPNPNAGEPGNLAHLPDVYYESRPQGFVNDDINGDWDPGEVSDFWKYLRDTHGIDLWDCLPMGPVFELGQILYLDGPYGRCLVSGLKPSKWIVEYEEVDTLDEAIALSRRVQMYDD